MKNIVLIAPPAAGKGVQSRMLQDRFNMIHISSGNLLRSEVDAKSEIGNIIEAKIKQGLLVEDSIVLKLIEKKLMDSDTVNGYILDGFPRTIEQALEFEGISVKMSKMIDYVFVINISRDIAMKRAVGRITCPKCSAIFNEFFDNFDRVGFCNNCQSKLEKRADDNEQVFNKRFDEYIKQSTPLIEYYEKKGLVHFIDSSDDREVPFNQIATLLNRNT